MEKRTASGLVAASAKAREQQGEAPNVPEEDRNPGPTRGYDDRDILNTQGP